MDKRGEDTVTSSETSQLVASSGGEDVWVQILGSGNLI